MEVDDSIAVADGGDDNLDILSEDEPEPAPKKASTSRAKKAPAAKPAKKAAVKPAAKAKAKAPAKGKGKALVGFVACCSTVS